MYGMWRVMMDEQGNGAYGPSFISRAPWLFLTAAGTRSPAEGLETVGLSALPSVSTLKTEGTVGIGISQLQIHVDYFPAILEIELAGKTIREWCTW
ncbi:hypothetical protein Vi05172_g3201 [Venturia inaequalis]|nr:hypothetical protein Vi05172_g3201 [Venturia inaequalis]